MNAGYGYARRLFPITVSKSASPARNVRRAGESKRDHNSPVKAADSAKRRVALPLHFARADPSQFMNPQVLEQSGAYGVAEVYNPYTDPAGLGLRTIGCDTFSGELLEVLRLTPDFGTPAEIEPFIRERIKRFEPRLLRGLAPVMRLERAFDGRLEVWSRLAPGFRLSAVLEWTEARAAAPSLNAALTVGDRLLGALVSLQVLDQTDGASGHGAIAIDQIVVTENGELTLTDYAFGTAMAALQWPREKLWRRFRIALPPAAGLARFDHRVDVTQAGVVIASLLAGRAFGAEEYPRKIETLVTEALQHACADDVEREERERLGLWLRAATEIDSRCAFKTAALAREALRAISGPRTDDTAAVGRWLRAARGVPEEPVRIEPVRETATRPAQSEAAAPPPAAEPIVEPVRAGLPEPAARGGGLFRKWLSRG